MKEKILIAISDVVLTNILIQKLKQSKYRVYTALDGKDVLEKMKTLSPDLVLIDIVLSGKNGYDVLQEKSYDRIITKIPVIIVSNSGVPIQMRLIPSTPTIKDYIIKTHIEPNEVLEKIAKVFGDTYIPISDDGKSPIENTKKFSILWVEDDRLLGSILSKKFVESGYKLLKANDADEAFAFLSKETPDIIILDIFLPKANGFDILQRIRNDRKFQKVPIMMLTNMSKQSDIEKAKILGADKFLVKAAVSPDEIVAEIDSLIKRKS